MILEDLVLFGLGMVIAFIAGHFFGKVSMLGDIVRAVSEEAEKELAAEQPKSDNLLTVEKHNNMYYAYVDGNFAAQGETFIALFNAVKSNKTYGIVNISRDTAAGMSLSREDASLMAQAIIEVYGEQIKQTSK